MKKSCFIKIQKGLCLLLVCILLLFSSGIGQWTPVAQAATAYWSNGNSDLGTARINGVAHGNGRWLAFSFFGDYATSDDGVTFSKSSSTLASHSCQGVAAEYAGQQWVVICEGGVILTSPTGDNNSWVPHSAPGVSSRLVSLATKEDGYSTTYVAVGNADGAIISSSNGIDWTNHSRSNVSGFYGVAYGEGKFIAVGQGTDSSAVLYSSTDGVQWNQISSQPPSLLNSITYGDGKFVAVGYNGCIYTSADGVTWQIQSSNVSQDLWSVTYGAGKFYAAGVSETIISSQNGITWELENGPVGGGKSILSIKVIEGRGVAVGSNGFIKTAAITSWPTASSNSLLSNLQVSPGNLTFNSATRDYTISVPYGTTSVTVTPTVQDAAATLTVNGVSRASGQGTSVTLEADGSTDIQIVVTAENGFTTSTYTITVNELAPSSIALLSNLQVSPGSLTFNSATRDYTIAVPYGTTSVTVTPTVQDAAATLTVNGVSRVSGQGTSVTLDAGGSTEIRIVVTAQNGITSSTYTITVSELAPINSPPTQINLSNSSVAENMVAGTVVGTLSAVDPDSDETAVFELISGDMDAFEISDNQLITKKQFDYETKSNYSIGIRVTDKANNTFEKIFTIQVTNVNEAPTGSITINNNDIITNSMNVTLHLTAIDPENQPLQMQFSNDNVTWSSWEPYTTSKSWSLATGDGAKTVYMKLRDSDSMDSALYSASILLDSTAPNGSLSINNDAVATNSQNVTLNISGTDENGPVQMRFSNDTVTWSAWENLISSKAWELFASDGSKTVHMQLRDEAGNTVDYSDTIILDSELPTGSIVINNGASKTGTTNVTLNLTGSDANGQIDMRLMNDSGSWTDWEPFSSTKSWTLRNEEGVRGVIVELRDLAGNTASFHDTIELDQTKPIVTGVSDGQLSNASLTITFNEGTATLNGDSFQSGEEVIEEGIYELTVMDEVNNTTTIRFTIDKTAPTAVLSINDGATATITNMVRLQLSNITESGFMRLSNDGITWIDDWQPISTVIDWTLEAGDGLKTVHLQLRDEAGNISNSSASILLDNTLPALSHLSLDIAHLSPAFDSAVTSYNTTVTNDVDSVSVTAAVYDEHSIISINGITVSNNVPVPINLSVGANVISIIVASQNNGQLIYTITVNRQLSNPSSNADLKDLTIANGILSPGFNPNILSYQTNVGSSVNSTTVTASVYDVNSTLTVNGLTVSNNAAVPVNLNYGMNDIEIIVTAADGITTKKYTIHVQRMIESNSNVPSGNSNKATTEGAVQQSDSSIQGFAVFVNGQKQGQIAKASIVKEGNTTSISAVIDPQKLGNHLAKLSEKPTVVVSVASNAEKISAVLTGDAVKVLEDRKGTLRIETPEAAYEIPANLIAIDTVSAQFGSGTPLSEITVHISIAVGTADKTNLIEQASQRQGFARIGESFDFSITAVHNGKSMRIDKFDSYVKREISIPEGANPTKITTAVVLNADGSVHHVPTAVTVHEGNYIATINSLTNSTYSLIWNQKSFADVQEHWAKEAVEDMASRLIVTGMNANEFKPNASITRAEFAAILVRGLGLSEDSKTDKFKDVASDDWYMGAVQKAVEYGLIEGYEDGIFGPQKTITREEALVIISRAMNILQENTTASLASLSKFKDHSTISAWAEQDIANTIDSGLVQGTGPKLEPKKPITRAETATLIQRLLWNFHLITVNK